MPGIKLEDAKSKPPAQPAPDTQPGLAARPCLPLRSEEKPSATIERINSFSRKETSSKLRNKTSCTAKTLPLRPKKGLGTAVSIAKSKVDSGGKSKGKGAKASVCHAPAPVLSRRGTERKE